jgi:hypothetical protein
MAEIGDRCRVGSPAPKAGQYRHSLCWTTETFNEGEILARCPTNRSSRSCRRLDSRERHRPPLRKRLIASEENADTRIRKKPNLTWRPDTVPFGLWRDTEVGAESRVSSARSARQLPAALVNLLSAISPGKWYPTGAFYFFRM